MQQSIKLLAPLRYSRSANARLPICWKLGRILLENGSLWGNNAGCPDFSLKHHQ